MWWVTRTQNNASESPEKRGGVARRIRRSRLGVKSSPPRAAPLFAKRCVGWCTVFAVLLPSPLFGSSAVAAGPSHPSPVTALFEDPNYPPECTPRYETKYEEKTKTKEVQVEIDDPELRPGEEFRRKITVTVTVTYTVIQAVLVRIIECLNIFVQKHELPVSSGKLRVTFSVNDGPAVTRYLAPAVEKSGQIWYRLDLESLSLVAGDVINLHSIQLFNRAGSLIRNYGPNVGSPPISLAVPGAHTGLIFGETAESRASKYRTWISIDPESTSCPGPFKYRIQKRQTKKLIRRSKTVVRITWINLPKRYVTNRQAGLWHYRTVDLGKGTYRSVIYGKCALLGGATVGVRLKR